MNRINLLAMQALTFASVLILFLSACAEEPLGSNDQTGKGHTITLRLSATVAPTPETKVSVTPTHSGSEAKATGFYYEMVSSDAETATATPGLNIEIVPIRKDSTDVNFTTKALATRAPNVLKNAYALLFTSGGAFNGCASIGAFTVGTPQDVTFAKVANPTATGCRLVIVANDNAAVTSYASSKGTGGFAGFTGTYAEFQQLTLTSGISKDEDVPYAGSATINLSQNEIGATAEVILFRTLAKITLNNSIFKITGGPARSNITLHNAGTPCFAPIGTNNYDGTGTTLTTSGFVATTAGGNANTTTWYVGENIQGTVGNISSAADRNSAKAPTNGCYIRIESAEQAIGDGNTSPAIGEEYIHPKSNYFTYDLYLGKSSDPKDFSLRRNTNYTITTEISGTLAVQKQLAAEDGRVALIETPREVGGLAIGCFGGPSGYTAGTDGPSISGSYTKLLLLEPNTSRTTATDNIMKVWGAEGIQYQTEARRYWDKTYIYEIKANGTIGGMSTAANGVYAYCNELTLGGVPKGTWHVPTQAQLAMIWGIYGGMKEQGFENYTAFDNRGGGYYYWSSTESTANNAWFVDWANGGYTATKEKTTTHKVRCTRDLSVSELAGQKVITNHALANGYPVIDLRELSPLGCILASAEASERRTLINKQTPSNTVLLPVGIGTSGPNGTWNIKLSSQYQVMCADHAIGTTDWANAYNLCKQYKDEGGAAGQWRLPTQRELSMIWVLHPQLQGKGGFTKFGAHYYWSSTESYVDISWYIRFGYGEVANFHGYKAGARKFRCIRDL